MGNILAKCLGPSPPPVVFTVCSVDGKAHDFGHSTSGTPVDKTAVCLKCNKPRSVIDFECEQCQQGNHEWVQDYVPVPTAQAQPVCLDAGPTKASVASAEKEADDLKKLIAEKQGAVAQATPVPAQGMAVMVTYKCKRCGLRQQLGADGAYVYDDYYMYGGGYMMGLEMGMMLGIMGAADAAYADPMYGDYYGGDFGGGFGADMGFDADEDDEGFDFE